MIIGGPTPRERIQQRQDARAWKLQRELDALEEDRRRILRAAAVHGIRPHVADLDDPWSETVLRACDLGCPQHPQAT